MNKPLVTKHNMSSRLAKLGKPSVSHVPSKTVQASNRIPSRPVAPPTRVAAAPRPRNDHTRLLPPGKFASSVISSMAKRMNEMPVEDAELELEQVEAQANVSFDLTQLDPGPDRDSVPFGYTCGSCKNFLALNDPRRDDPDFMETYLSAREHCPVAMLEFVKLKNRDPNEVVARATSTACSKFSVAISRMRPELRSAMADIKLLTKGEFDVLAVSLDAIRRQKALGEQYGMQIGEKIKTPISGREGLYDAVVIGYKGKNVLLQVRIDSHVLTLKRPVINAQIIED
jgi:hypothetical protein